MPKKKTRDFKVEIMDNSITFFRAPISNKVPKAFRSVKDVYNLVKSDENLKRTQGLVDESEDYKAAKGKLLDWIMPGGLFASPDAFGLIRPSCKFPLDIDGLKPEDVEACKQAVFNDPVLKPELVFVSPSHKGVKAIINYAMQPDMSPMDCHRETATALMEYFDATYEHHGWKADRSGSDITRRCFLAHDPKALYREFTFADIINLKKEGK